MLFVSKIFERHVIRNPSKIGAGECSGETILTNVPAVTHIDLTARIQTVSDRSNQKFHALLKKFYQNTGCPMLVNTSFNIRGEPIVCNPEDAFKCFMGTGLDALAIGNCILIKEQQKPDLVYNYSEQVDPD